MSKDQFKKVTIEGRETFTINFKEAGQRVQPFNPLDATKDKDFMVSDPAADYVNHLVIGEGKIPNNESVEKMDKQRVLEVLNSLEVIESEGGESAYILVEASKDNIEWMNSVGISNAIINKYKDNDAIDILSLASGEKIAHQYRMGKLVEAVEVEIDEYNYISFYKLNGMIVMSGEELQAGKWAASLSPDERKQLKEFL